MLVVVWLRQAQFNLDHQIRYIAVRNVVAAMEQDAIVAHAVARLAEFPESGRQGSKPHTRELVIAGTPFAAIYRIVPARQEIHIIRLLHAKQKYPAE